MQAARAAAQPAQSQTTKAAGAADDDDLDPNQYHERRVLGIKNAKDNNENPYPHKFQTTIEVPAYITKYQDRPAGEHDTNIVESVAGNVCL